MAPDELLVEARVPAGWREGESVLLLLHGKPFRLHVPPGAKPGEQIVVRIAEPLEGEGEGEEAVGEEAAQPSGGAGCGFELVVPEGCEEGDAFLVEAGGRQFEVVVPDGCGPGSLITVELPEEEGNDEEGGGEEERVGGMDEGRARDEERWVDEEVWAEGQEGVGSDGDRLREGDAVQEPSLLRQLSSSSSLGSAGGGKFAVGQQVEVMRSDGSWSLAAVEEFEEMGCTYTVRLCDGRCKYMVEEDELRIPRSALRRVVWLEFVFLSGGERYAKAWLSRVEDGGEEEDCGILVERSCLTKESYPGTRWLLRSQDGEILLDTVARAWPSKQRLEIVVDPLRHAHPPGMNLRPGAPAMIAGMVKRTDLNGANCVVLWWEEASCRWATQLRESSSNGRLERILVRPDNLIPLNQ
ncbi:MAG: hypothetical protein SGPRY_011883 [Prymnesium sp.]